MNLFESAAWARLVDPQGAFESPVTVGILSAIVLAMAGSKLIIVWGKRTNKFSESTQLELNARFNSWVLLVVAIVAPILMGALYTVLAVWLLCMLCHGEYARTVGIQGNRLIQVVFAICVTVLAFASIDHFDRLFFACSSLGVGLLVVLSVTEDQPHGFIRRTSLGVLGFLLFGFSMSYLGLLTNNAQYRPLLLSTILAVEANDIFAYCCGKLIKGPKLIPNTSPGKTISGSVGALCLTSILVAGLFHCMFRGTAMDHVWLLLCLGGLISAVGQLGDLTLSAIKRDIGIKDFGSILPGHGGWLDRFDSLVLVPPVVYHFLSLVLGPVGLEQPTRWITGG